jgi:hypothetical protein
MSKNTHKSLTRRLDALASSEARIHERLLGLRGEVDLIAAVLDRVTLPPRRPRLRAGDAAALLSNLVRFKPRGTL